MGNFPNAIMEVNGHLILGIWLKSWSAYGSPVSILAHIVSSVLETNGRGSQVLCLEAASTTEHD